MPVHNLNVKTPAVSRIPHRLPARTIRCLRPLRGLRLPNGKTSCRMRRRANALRLQGYVPAQRAFFVCVVAIKSADRTLYKFTVIFTLLS